MWEQSRDVRVLCELDLGIETVVAGARRNRELQIDERSAANLLFGSVFGEDESNRGAVLFCLSRRGVVNLESQYGSRLDAESAAGLGDLCIRARRRGRDKRPSRRCRVLNPATHYRRKSVGDARRDLSPSSAIVALNERLLTGSPSGFARKHENMVDDSALARSDFEGLNPLVSRKVRRNLEVLIRNRSRCGN